jgi:threonine dehydrogenase-like Zn-dependent dehydrogenase
LIRKPLTLIGSSCFDIAEYGEILDVLVGNSIDLERLATQRFSVDEAETPFQLFDERKAEKAVVVF